MNSSKHSRFTHTILFKRVFSQPLHLPATSTSGLLEKFGDPYAQYYPPEEWSEINDVAEGRDVVGIGVAFAQDTRDRRPGMRGPEVVSVVPKSPAAEQGVPHFDEGCFVFLSFTVYSFGRLWWSFLISICFEF